MMSIKEAWIKRKKPSDKFNFIFFAILATIGLWSIPIPESVTDKYILGISISLMVLMLPQIGILYVRLREKEREK